MRGVDRYTFLDAAQEGALERVLERERGEAFENGRVVGDDDGGGGGQGFFDDGGG